MIGKRFKLTPPLVLLSFLAFGFKVTFAQQLAWQAPAPNSDAFYVTSEGTTYIADNDGVFRSFNANGKVLWTLNIGSSIVGGLVTTSSGGFAVDTSDSRVVVISSAGQKLWEKTLPAAPTGNPAVGTDGSIYVSAGTSLLAYSSSGNLNWTYDDGNPLAASPAVSDAGVVVGADEGGLYLVDLTGKLIYHYAVLGPKPDYLTFTPSGTVNYQATDNEIIGLTKTGDVAFDLTPNDATQIYSLGRETSQNGVIYTILGGNLIQQITTDGQIGWSYDAGASITSPLTITSDNNLIFGTADGKIVLINLLGKKQSEIQISSAPIGVASATGGRYFALLGGTSTGTEQGSTIATTGALLVALVPTDNTPPVWVASGLSGLSIYDLARDGKDAHTFYAASDKMIAVSTDDGKTWTQKSVSVPEGGTTINYLATASDGTVYASSDIFLFSSDSSGNFGVTNRADSVGAIAVDPKTPSHLIFSNPTDKLFDVSDDSGNSLTEDAAPAAFTNLTWSSDETLYGASESGLYEYVNGNWTQVASGRSTGFAISSDGKTVYAGSDSGVMKSVDSGKTFTTNGGDQLVGTVYRLAISPDNTQEIVAGTVINSTSLINASIQGVNLYSSVDGGTNWVIRDKGLENVYPHEIVAGSGYYLMATNDGVWRLDSSNNALGGSSTGTTVVYGDLNGDGKVNVQDATIALRIAVGLITPTADQLKAGDVAPAGNPDGKINVSDATRILRAAVGLDKLQ